MSSKSTVSSKPWLSVSCTSAITPTRRTASSSATRPASPSGSRRACSRSSAATVCRLFFTRWWISRIVASLVSSSSSRRRSSDTSRSSSSAPTRLPPSVSGMARIDTLAPREVTSVRHGARPVTTTRQRLVDRRLVAQQVGDHLGQQLADDVADVAEPVHRRERVGAGVGHDPVDVEPDHAVTDARRTTALPGGRGAVGELPRRDHPRQRVGERLVGQLQPARRAHRREVGMPRDHRERAARRARRGWLPRGPACRRGRSGPSRGRSAGRGRPGRAATDDRGGCAGRRRPRRTPSARSWAHVGHGQPALEAARHPQHEVAERQVRDQLPVTDEQLQPLDLGGREVGRGLEHLVEGGHAGSLIAGTGRPCSTGGRHLSGA